jgi:hypothetical protein
VLSPQAKDDNPLLPSLPFQNDRKAFKGNITPFDQLHHILEEKQPFNRLNKKRYSDGNTINTMLEEFKKNNQQRTQYPYRQPIQMSRKYSDDALVNDDEAEKGQVIIMSSNPMMKTYVSPAIKLDKNIEDKRNQIIKQKLS